MMLFFFHTKFSTVTVIKYILKIQDITETDFFFSRFYNTSMHQLDFVVDAEESTRSVNSYFDRQTEGKASQMIARVPSPSTNLLLLCALYFRGTLDMDMGTFKEEGRNQAPFTLMRSRQARVRYVQQQFG